MIVAEGMARGTAQAKAGATGGRSGMSIFAKKKPHGCAPAPARFACDAAPNRGRGGFSFDGHRLSSLYRRPSQIRLRLIAGYFAASSLQKYSNPPLAPAGTPGRYS